MITFVKKQPFLALFACIVLGLVAMAGRQLASRLVFGWDLYIWSESPFMTNMLKLDGGQPIYTMPDDANSFVYSPGLEYLTYGLLKPFGVQLDIRFCRLVSVGFGVLAALALMRCSILLARAVAPDLKRGPLFAPLSAACFFLVIYHNFTSDIPHPDNLYIFHFAVVLMLTFEAIARPSIGRAVAAILFAALGVYVKQMAAMSAAGVALTLAATAPKPFRAAAWMIPLALVASSTALGGLWAMKWVKFYTYDVLTGQSFTFGLRYKLGELANELFKTYRALPLALYGIALLSGLRSRNRLVVQYFVAHLLVGGIEVAPSVLAYLKTMGVWNNLAIIEVWAAVPFIPVLLSLMTANPQGEPTEPRSRLTFDFARFATMGLALAFVFSYTPWKQGPEETHYHYCKTVQEAVSRDLQAGKRVLVAHGAMFQINGGSRQIPLDRSNSVLELFQSGKSAMAGTQRRINEKYYDTIYLNSFWYSPEVYTAIKENYQEVQRFSGTYDKLLPRYEIGSMGLMLDVPVYVRK